jgi:hypothetical protein
MRDRRPEHEHQAGNDRGEDAADRPVTAVNPKAKIPRRTTSDSPPRSGVVISVCTTRDPSTRKPPNRTIRAGVFAAVRNIR